MAVNDIVPAAGEYLEDTLAAASPDLLRTMIREFAQRMMDAEVEQLCGAGYGEIRGPGSNEEISNEYAADLCRRGDPGKVSGIFSAARRIYQPAHRSCGALTSEQVSGVYGGPHPRLTGRGRQSRCDLPP
ncbi:hypothetical protein ACIBI2_13615 [Streptosporangium canum]|uniref:hypothetical protein n=1 Tax=Streptosporangium canum TaxID=324952 RepID=UPI003792D73A